ncbi:hypothetical protein SAMN04515647_2552 [Cohaesibacter sp. ES.047]|nr:hypothetical protein SAMN04515647_2552 [Cohaesibacter sp. ES.047]
MRYWQKSGNNSFYGIQTEAPCAYSKTNRLIEAQPARKGIYFVLDASHERPTFGDDHLFVCKASLNKFRDFGFHIEKIGRNCTHYLLYGIS